MAWSVTVVETLSGDAIASIPAASGTWRKQINGFGQGRHVFNLRDALTARPRVYWQDVFAEIRRTLVVSWDGEAVYAGVIVSTDWNGESGELTVVHQEVRWLLDARLPHTINEWGPAGKTVVSGKSLRGVARALVALAFRSGAVQRDLPVDVGADESGASSREWQWWNFASVEELLSEVQDAEGGPDVAFEPEWRGDGLWWVLKLGSPRLSGVTHEFVRGLPRSSVVGWRHIREASKQLTGAFALGAGSEHDMLVVGYGVASQPDMPVLERAHGFKTVDSMSVLGEQVRSVVKAHALPSEQWQFSLRGDALDVAGMRLGSTVRVLSPEDEWDAAGDVEGYVIAVEGSNESDELRVVVV